MVVLLTTSQRRAEQQVADPGLNESKGGAVRVPGGHHHLRGENSLMKFCSVFPRCFRSSVIYVVYLNPQFASVLPLALCSFIVPSWCYFVSLSSTIKQL